MVDRRVLQTIIAEAGGDPTAMAAVAAVINNRAQQTGKTPLQVVKQRGQFEGYSNPGPAVARQLNDSKLLQKAQSVFTGVSSGTIADPTNGATMYHADYVTPYWAKSANKNGTVNIGGNVFYKGSGSPQTAVAAIDALAPNPQSRPVSLAYAQTPSSVRAILVNPDGTPASLADALAAKYGAVSNVPRGTSAQSLYGNIALPPAIPVSRPTSLQQPNVLTTRAVNSVPINPNTGNPYTGVELAQQAANTEAARLRGSMPSGRVANIPVVPQPVSSPQGSLQSALNDYAARLAAQKTGSIKTVAQAGQVALPPNVVPRSAQSDMDAADARLRSQANGSAYTGGWGSTALLPHSAIPTQERIGPTPSPVLAYAGDQNTGIPASVAAINAATVPLPRPRPVVPTGPAFNAGTWGSAGVIPSVPVNYGAKIPLTQFNTVNPGSQIQPRIASHIASSPIGHLFDFAQGNPVQGGILSLLQNAMRPTVGPTSAPRVAAIPAPFNYDQYAQNTFGAVGVDRGVQGKGAWAV